jgi:hypothetical protein
MTGNASARARVFWFELAQKWAIRTPPLADERKARMFTAALRQTCDAVFHQAMQAWTVADSALDAAREIVARYYPRYEFVERPRYVPPPPPPDPEAQAYETFCVLVGWEGPERLSRLRARTLYRKAAARLHPDAGGSPEQMATLNAAWSTIKATLA